MILFRRDRIETACRIEVDHTDECLSAHVELADDIAIRPGDRVRVHGSPIVVPFGRSAVFERSATVERAGAVERMWTRIAGHFEMAELYDVSFSPGRVG